MRNSSMAVGHGLTSSVATLLLFFGCTSRDPAPVSTADAGLDAADAAPTTDAPAAGTGAFGAKCTKHSDCASAYCVSSGVCSKPCGGSMDCPPGPEWSCSNKVCDCRPSGKDVCDGRDNDCDAIIDDPGYCAAGSTCKDAVCVCPPQNQCGAACVDITTDKDHCGTCTNVCAVSCGSSACRTVAQIGTGQQHACARMSDGAVACWGWNDYGQLGREASAVCTASACQLAPGSIPGLKNVVEIAVGSVHTCARLATGGVKCWGDDDVGELGLPAPGACGPRDCAAAPVDVPGLADTKQLALGGGFSCAVAGDGSVRCWGANPVMQLGYPTTTKCGSGLVPCSQVATVVPGAVNIAQVAAGDAHTCAVARDGTVQCWGLNNYGQLGLTTSATCGGEPCSPAPTAVPGIATAAQISAGGSHTCARLTDGTVMCWGANGYGQLGYATTAKCSGLACSATPTLVPGLANVEEISLGAAHTCARLTDGSLSCWGSDDSGVLGFSTTTQCAGAPCAPTPTPVPGLANVGGVSSGFSHTCAMLKTGSAYCWGYNYFGQLGDGTRSNRTAAGPLKW